MSRDNRKHIRRYYNNYVKYFPEKWEWRPYTGSIEEQTEWNKTYMATRARRSNSIYKNSDLNPPDFYSLERDAEQFGLHEYEFTDTFGLKWVGHKGTHAYAGAPDYEGHLYYDSIDEYDEVEISEIYSEFENPPESDVYQLFVSSSRNEWIDIKNLVTATYHYVVENHLFKDTYIDLAYGEGWHERIYEEHYKDFIDALKKFNKEVVLQRLLAAMDEHFEKLKNSEREDEREYWPGMTAAEYFQVN